MSDINELEKEVGLLREKVNLLRALEELKTRESAREYPSCPYPIYPYYPYSPWWGIDLIPKYTWIGGTTSIDSDIQHMANALIFTGGK